MNMPNSQIERRDRKLFFKVLEVIEKKYVSLVREILPGELKNGKEVQR